VPQSSLSRLGLPADAFGLSVDPTVEAHVDLARKEGGAIDGHAKLDLYGLRFAGSRPPNPALDVRLQAGLSGDSADAIALKDALVGVGAAKGKVAGGLALKDRSIRVEASMKWPAGAAATLPSSFVLDTRDLAARPGP